MSAAEFWSLVEVGAADACWPWMGGTNGGSERRGRIKFEGRPQYAYRIAWQLVHGYPIPAESQGCHSCDNPRCVNPGHIFIGTHRDNMQDAINKGRLAPPPLGPTGIEHHAATVTADVISQLVFEYRATSATQKEMAARCGVSQTTFGRWARAVGRIDAGVTPQPRQFKPCGTRAAYERHRRNGERPCDPCRAAELQDQQVRRARRAIGVAA